VVTTGVVRVDGRDLEVLTAGSGRVTVVLEAGLTASAAAWLPIIPRLAPVARVLAVSRAGYGRSTPRRAGAAQGSVDDLVAVLDQRGETGPLVLVGHSWGGPLCRLLAAQQPSRVVALVLVDATHEGFAGMRRRGATALGLLGMTLGLVKAHTGLTRRELNASKGAAAELLARLPEPARVRLVDEFARPATWRQARRDFPAVKRLLLQLQREPLAPPEVPVVGVIGGKGEGRAGKLRAVVRAAYEPWLASMPDGRLVVAPNSGHLVPFEDEDLLVKVIEELVIEVEASR
jgi:pimeloyl-ACP methyl ester carboxylesterase